MSKVFNIKSENVVVIPSGNKEEVLKILIEKLGKNPEIVDKAELETKIFEREALMSTGIGLGIAVPHVRLASISNVVVALGICPDGIDDYEALDGVPVNIVCMIAANSEQHNEYIQALATLSKQLKCETVRQRLVGAQDADEAYRLLIDSME